MTVIVLSS